MGYFEARLAVWLYISTRIGCTADCKTIGCVNTGMIDVKLLLKIVLCRVVQFLGRRRQISA
jgi:hypothetical protein